MEWKNQQILRSFDNVVKDCKTLSIEQMNVKYETFKSNFERLYGMAIESVAHNTVEQTRSSLSKLLETRENINTKKINQLDGDLQIGNMLGEKYIYPLVGKPTTRDMIDALNKIKNEEES